MKSRKVIFITQFMLLSLLTAGCGQLAVGIENPNPTSSPLPTLTQPVATRAPTSAPTLSLTDESPATPVSDTSDFWVESGDPRTGVRFAVPCFWPVEVPAPEQDPSGIGSFPIKNFTPEFVQNFGPKGGDLIWENGAVKADIVYFVPSDWSLPSGLSLEEFAQGLYPSSETSELELTSTEPLEINGQQSLLLTTQNKTTGQIGKFYLFRLNDDLYMGFSPVPLGAVDHPDIQAILHSIALQPETPVKAPEKVPEAPPDGVDAPCMASAPTVVGTEPGGDKADLDCSMVGEDKPLDWLQCNIQDGLRSRNVSALMSFMSDPVIVGYWRSESQPRTPQEFHDELVDYRLPPDTSGLTFTTHRGSFPALDGAPIENMLPPNASIVRIIYSEGWGLDGQGAAMIFLAEDPNGGYYWYGTVLAFDHFE